MQRLFVTADSIAGDSILIEGSDAIHISRSLRMAAGDRITVCDMQKHEYVCEISGFTKDTVSLTIIERRDNDTEPPFRAVLYQALPKGDKLDMIVQKAVELGVTEIVPFISERCISRPDRKSASGKIERMRRIAREAAMQCGRGIIPEIRSVISFSEAVRDASAGAAGAAGVAGVNNGDCADANANAGGNVFSFICYEGDGTLPLGRLLRTEDGKHYDEYRFLIGAEGGFSLSEVEEAVNNGLTCVGLGSRILRCETASLYVLSALSYECELR